MGNKISKSPVQSSQIKGGGSADGIEHTQAFSSRRGDLREVREAPVMPLGPLSRVPLTSGPVPLILRNPGLPVAINVALPEIILRGEAVRHGATKRLSKLSLSTFDLSIEGLLLFTSTNITHFP